MEELEQAKAIKASPKQNRISIDPSRVSQELFNKLFKQLACSLKSVVCPTQDRSHGFLPDLPPIERTKTRSNRSPGGSEYIADAITRVSLGYPSIFGICPVVGGEISNGKKLLLFRECDIRRGFYMCLRDEKGEAELKNP
jgi:hypothetical protein